MERDLFRFRNCPEGYTAHSSQQPLYYNNNEPWSCANEAIQLNIMELYMYSVCLPRSPIKHHSARHVHNVSAWVHLLNVMVLYMYIVYVWVHQLNVMVLYMYIMYVWVHQLNIMVLYMYIVSACLDLPIKRYDAIHQCA